MTYAENSAKGGRIGDLKTIPYKFGNAIWNGTEWIGMCKESFTAREPEGIILSTIRTTLLSPPLRLLQLGTRKFDVRGFYVRENKKSPSYHEDRDNKLCPMYSIHDITAG